MIEHFQNFAAYNHWANQRLYSAAADLSDAQYRQDCQVAFNSMHGTLNHILLADTIWMSRFQQKDFQSDGLDTILHTDFDALRDARMAMDQQITDYINGLDPTRLVAYFSYTPVTMPEPVTLQLAPALSHLFNHQTHHRGQAHAILTRLTGEAPPLDLIYFHLDK